jgi:hypothetical protein
MTEKKECWILRAENNAPRRILVNEPSQAWREKHVVGGLWLEHVSPTPPDYSTLAAEMVTLLAAALPLVTQARDLEACAYGSNYVPGKAEHFRKLAKDMRAMLDTFNATARLSDN